MMKSRTISCGSGGGCAGATYGLGFIGAVVYYVSHVTGFWMGVLGVLKALVWPRLLSMNCLFI